jgi:hypothetical protein
MLLRRCSQKMPSFGAVLTDVLYWPFEYIYVNGPRWLGMWEGLPPRDICTGLTYVPSDAWSVATVECNLLIRRHAHATVVGIAFVSSLMGLHAVCYACTVRSFTKHNKA